MTAPTTVVAAAFSASGKVAFDAVGASLSLVRLTVTCAVSLSAPGPAPSLTRTVRVNVGEVSKSSNAALSTVIAPMFEIAKAPLPLPAVMS